MSVEEFGACVNFLQDFEIDVMEMDLEIEFQSKFVFYGLKKCQSQIFFLESCMGPRPQCQGPRELQKTQRKNSVMEHAAFSVIG